MHESGAGTTGHQQGGTGVGTRVYHSNTSVGVVDHTRTIPGGGGKAGWSTNGNRNIRAGGIGNRGLKIGTDTINISVSKVTGRTTVVNREPYTHILPERGTKGDRNFRPGLPAYRTPIAGSSVRCSETR